MGASNYTYSSLTPQTFHDWTTREDSKIASKDNFWFVIPGSVTPRTRILIFRTLSATSMRRAGRRMERSAGITSSARALISEVTYGGTNFKNTCCYYPGFDKLNPGTLGLPGYTTAYAQQTEADLIMNFR